MGLLDDLKRQADTLRTQNSLHQSLREENLRAVDEAMHRAFQYLHELFKHYADFWIRWTHPQVLSAERVMPADIAKTRQLLWTSNVKFTEDEKKAAHGPVQSVRFNVPAAVTVAFTMSADHEKRRVLFYGKNALRLGNDDFAAPADELSESMLEELAKLLLGQPNEFTRRYRTVLPPS